ncbi:MAG TPA: hypothetical protein VH331_04255 [Allosphingosinicella sp.]|jgi:hypothetical protein|nr:hypothetical protein [Allosphingosinicella sp.]
MNMGAESAAQAEPEGFGTDQQEEWLGAAVAESQPPPADAADPDSAPDMPAGIRALGAVLIVLAIGWVGLFGWSLWQRPPALAAAPVANAIATFCAPLILLALLWIWLGRTPRREAERFTASVDAMRRESLALQTVLEIVSGKIEANHGRLRGEAERLMSLGDEASDRLGRVTYYLSKETTNLDKQAAALDAAAAAARVDIGVLLHDLPRAEEQARAVAEAMKEAGLTAHGHASALEAQLSALAVRGREADEVLGGSAQRLAAQVARIESGAAAASATMGEASGTMTGAVDAAMARAAEAVDAARTGLEAQSAAVLASIEHNRAALEQAGEEAARNLAHRLDEIGTRIQGLADRISAQDAASHALVTGLARELTDLDGWFDRLGRTQTSQGQALSESLAAMRGAASELLTELGQGSDNAAILGDRARQMADALAALAGQMREAVPEGLARIEAQAGRTIEAASALVPLVESAEAAAQRTAARIEEAETAVAYQREQLDSFLARVSEGGAGAEEQLRRLAASAAEAQESARTFVERLGDGSGRAAELAQRTEEMARSFDAVAAQLEERLPGGLARIEAQTERARDAAAALAPVVQEVESSAERALAQIGGSEAAIVRQREALEALLARIEEGGGGAEAQLQALGAAAVEAQQAAARIAAETGPELIEALVRVRETAHQAAERAREAIAATIPQSAAALGEASREALSRAVAETVERQMAELSAVSERALATARLASERLTRQMLALSETSATVEERIEDERREREVRERQNLSRRTALLIESLNSTAIDVTKILSNDVTDGAWAAYMKGDRGVFTRRAVRLLDNAEAREIARHYEEEPEFRDQVNRYIHDFEAMLRPILADREGGPLGITLLSSDMGKLYVALAQAIERLR